MNINIQKRNGLLGGWALLPGKELLVSRWGNRRILLNLCFLLITLGTAVYSIEQARWIYPQPYLTLELLLSVLLVWMMMVYRFPGWILHLLAIAIGASFILWQGMMILPDGANLRDLFSIIDSWRQGGGGLQEGNAKIILGVFLLIVTWIAGYLSTWFVLRHNNAWLAVLTGLVIIIINLSSLPAIHFIFFIFFLLASVLLIIQTKAIRLQSSPGSTSSYSAKSLRRLIVPLCGIVILAVLTSWITPQLRFSGLQDIVATSLPWTNTIEESDFNIFKVIPSKQAGSLSGGLQDVSFGKFWYGSDDIKYTVKSPQPAYWQVNVYEKYTGKQWISIPATEELLKKNTEWGKYGNSTGRIDVEYEVIPNVSTDIVLLTGDFNSAEMPVIVRQNNEKEVISARSVRILNPNEKYTVKTSIADYSAGSLSAAGVDYPESIKGVYLQLPDGFPRRISILSENLTNEAKTPYEKIIAINTYLSKIPYSPEVDVVPEGADAVEDFLFTQQKGFCLHFASAMTAMLRSVGVPARLAAGYIPGDPGAEPGTYILRDKYYHAWTQVYFPGYGWIDFEPTPSGFSGSQVQTSTPLVSTSSLSQLSESDYLNLASGAQFNNPGNDGAGSPGVDRVISGKLPFANILGLIVFILLSALAAVGLLYGVLLVFRPYYRNKIWNVDRESPASSAYGNLQRLAAMKGIIPTSLQTPLEVASQIAEIIPEQAKNLEFLVRAYLDKRFGPDKGKPGLYEEAEILKARVMVYNAILEKKGKIQRFFWRS